ncbi:restriction endonuclease subunit S [Streptomyces mirabilis]|uniref:restriction endonuclease subunit S n=1 Tax=Streptomyces mirabilis TaxID=68239 RepID=UPI0033FAA776
MRELPAAWCRVPLQDVVPSVDYGISEALDADTRGIPVLRMNNIQDDRFDLGDLRYSSTPVPEKMLLQHGDVLFNRTNSIDHIGKTAMWQDSLPAASFASYLVRLNVDVQRVLPAYLAQWLMCRQVRRQVRSISTAAVQQVNVNPSRLLELNIDFPVDLMEQQRIVDVLDSVMEFQRGIEASIAKFEALRFGVMEELVELECGLFGDVLKQGPQNGIYKPASSYGLQGTPIVRIDSFSRGKSDLTWGLLRVAASGGEVARYGLDVGDIVINRVNTPELVGKSTSVRRLGEPTIFESNMMRCKLHRSLADPVFTETWLGSSIVKRYFLTRAKSAISQASINGDDVRNCPFPKMDMPRQLAFLERLDAVEDQRLAEVAELAKLRQLKQGLVDDLLSGRRSVSAVAA